MHETITSFIRNKKHLTGLTVTVFLLVVVAVFALTDKQVIHVFPTDVASEGWMQETQALEQTLGAQALAGDFDSTNSAYVVFTRDESAPTVEDASIEGESVVESTQGAWGGDDDAVDSEVSTEETNSDVSPTEPDIETVTPETIALPEGDVVDEQGTTGEVNEESVAPSTESEPVQEEPTPVAPLPDVSMLEYLNGVAHNTIARMARAQEVDTTQEDVSTSIPDAPLEEEVVSGTEEGASSETETPTSEEIVPREEVVNEEEQTLPEIPAETNNTTPSEERSDDVRVCRVLSIACHTIELSGFDIGSVLSEETVLSYELHASIGAMSENDRFTDDKVLVRYFYRGRWHLAGEISIQDETSNFTNGGHFTFALPNMTGWDALRDFRVEFEFVRAASVRTEVYLDAVWVESTYRAQSDTLPEFPENVRAELAELEASRRGDVLKTDTATIELPIRSTTPGNLVIRSNTEALTSPGTEDVYLSITNIGETDQDVDLSFIMPDEMSEPEYVRQWMYNVPEEQIVEEYGSVAHYCESGWEMSADAPEGSYVCSDRLEDLPCDELNTDGTNCIEHNVLLGETSELVYTPGWREVALGDGQEPGDKSVFARVRKWFRFTGIREEQTGIVFTGGESYTLASGQSLYFVARMKYPQISEGGFAVHAESDDENAVLDLGWKSAWRYRLPIVFEGAPEGDRMELTFTRDSEPHLFAHVTEWGSLFFREQGVLDASWLPYTYTVLDADTVTLTVDISELMEHTGLYVFYGENVSSEIDERHPSRRNIASDVGIDVNTDVSAEPVNTGQADVEDTLLPVGGDEARNPIAGYTVEAPQEVLIENEPSHRLVRGSTPQGTLTEDGALVFAYRTSNLARQGDGYADVLSQDEYTIEAVTLVHESDEEVPDTRVVRMAGNEWKLDTGMSGRTFKPGKYTLTVRTIEGDRAHEETQIFYWGVLTWNSTKSVYAPGETVTMHMGALTDTGHTICDASLRLRIRDAQGVESTVPVVQSGQCNGNNVVDVPDYSATYPVGGTGVYDVILEELGLDGTTVIHSINETITVESATPYVIERIGATRIYPVADYRMTLRVSVVEGYAGSVREAAPAYFGLSDYGNARESVEGDTRYLEWDVALAPGEVADLSYTFDAPDISPYIYRVGPASLGTDFTEYRQWQIASDAVGNMLILWDNATYVPTGWTCVSCTIGDPFYQRFIMGSSTYNATGGATTHTHTGSGTVYTGGSGATENNGSGAIEVTGHGHTYTPTIASATNVPPYRQLRVLRYTSAAGEPPSLPAGAIVYFDATVPSGYTRYSAQDGYFIYGENTPGTTGGTSTHTNAISGTTGASDSGSVGSRGGGTPADAAPDAHTHTVTGNTGSVNHEPPYIGAILGQLNATSSPVNGMISMWTEDVPSGWVTVSGSSEAFSNKFVKPGASYGSTGGTSTHTHSNVTGLTTSSTGGASSRTGSTGVNPHTHSVDVTGISTTNNLPPYVTVVFGKRFSTDPLYTQNYYRFYANVNAEPPTDPWPVGATNLAENARITVSDYTSKGDIARMRMSVQVTNATSTAYSERFKLQYAAGSSCSDVGLVWSDVGAIGSTTAPWRGYNNAGVTDGATTSSTTLSVSDVFETYEEENPSASTTNAIGIGQDGEWDWVVQHHEALPGTDYCFRMVKSDGTALSGYTNYPQVITDQAPTAPTLLTLFDNEKTGTTTPLFTFVTTDPEGDPIEYQIQIDDDYLFGSAEVDTDSISNTNAFDNLDTPADKSPFFSGDRIQFTLSSPLANNTTYWWRVRGRDTGGSDQWGSWSSLRSFTASTSAVVSTWLQTTDEQFNTDTYSGAQANGSDQVTLITGSTTGTLISSEIDFDWGTDGNAWGYLLFTDTETSSDLKYQMEFYDTVDSAWELIPDVDLSGNSTGFDTSPVSLLTLDTTTYNRIRLKANFTNSGASPVLSDWSVEWGYRVAQPTLSKLFDNEKTSTTTPSFEFTTTDPQADDLIYEFVWSTDYTFTTGTTSRTSDVHTTMFVNLASSTQSSQFTSGDTIRFTVQGGDALTNTSTYWWRVRARDPDGGNAWSEWSEQRSVTVDIAVVASTWYQTTDEQFDRGSLFGVTTVGNAVTVATSVKDVLIAYGEGTVTTPRYRLWNGTSWGSELSALDVGAAQYNIITRAHPTAEIYAMATIGTDADVNVQIYESGTWGNLQEMTTTIGNSSARGADIAFETTSGDLMAVYCDGDADPSYRVYNESTGWGTAGAVNLSSTSNCEWIRLASDPTSDEIIVVSLDAVGGQYEAQVWNGSSWGNATVMGSIQSTGNEGMAVAYEESGGQAMVAVSDGNPARFRYDTWNGTAWAGAATQSIGNDFEWGNLTPDVGTDAMVICYIDEDEDIGAVHWTGSAWTSQAEVETVGNADTDRPVDCVYETSGIRNGYVMMSYSDDTNVRYQSWNGATWSGEGSISTITDSATVQSVRSDDGLVLTVAFDDVNGQLDFSYWNGSSWSAVQTLEGSPSVTGAPWREPYMMTPRNSAVEGTLYSPEIDFNDGSGPQWDDVSWTDSEPGASTLTYQVQYYDTASSSWKLVPDSAIPGNSTGTSTSPIDISGLNTTTYNELRIKANFTCDSGNCPTLSDWTLRWSEGFTVSGIAKQYDQTTNVTSGTVAVAVNGSLQIGKTAIISGGTWTINNVNAFSGDTVTVWIDGANEENESVGVTRYDGSGPISGMTLYERHLGIGSDDSPTLTNTLLASFDNSASGDEDIFYDVDISNNLYVCEATQPSCGHEQLWIRNGSTFAPATSTVEYIHTNDVDIEGTLTSSGNIFEVSGSWTNAGIFTADTSTVVFDATSTTETINSSSATTSAFNNVTFGQGASSATWTLSSLLDINGTLTLTSGTLAPGSGYNITIGDDLVIGSAGNFAKSTGTTTFDGTGTSQWSDASSQGEDMGVVVVNGTGKTVGLTSNVSATTLTIGADDIMALGGFTLNLGGSFYNLGSLVPQSGTVLFTATTTGNEINGGASSFYNLTFNGIGGNWAFPNGAVTATNDVTMTNGQVIMPTGTTTIGGSLAVTGGTFVHNNGAVVFNSTLAETITASTSPFHNLLFTGSGSWLMQDTNATSSNNVTLTNGTVTFPTGVFAVGGSLTSTAGIFNHASGTVRLYSTGPEEVSANSAFYNLLVAGVGGNITVTGPNLTIANNLSIVAGNMNFPTGTLTIRGSLDSSAGTFYHSTGTVAFTASTTGKSVNTGASRFYNVTFNNTLGGWTVTGNATAENDWSLTNLTAFIAPNSGTIEVRGDFTNSVGGSGTDWTGSTLYLNAGTTTIINVSTTTGDTYNILRIATSTHVRMWNSDAASYDINALGSLYSQDHAIQNGDLYIWGSYERTSGTEYWRTDRDFDGSVLSGLSERQVDVRFADGAHATITSATLDMTGTSTATTTIQNQGSGTYTVSVSNGIFSARYFNVTNLGSNGLTITGSSSVPVLRDGYLELSVNGGTLLRVSSSTIDANPAKQLDVLGFATTSAITGTNVAVIGTAPSSYWTFRDHYGNLDGENFDNDPTGNPGNLRWDDSAFDITVAGTVYSGIGSGVPAFCNGSTQVIYLRVDGVFSSSTSCATGTGAYSIANVNFSGDAVLTVYIKSPGATGAVVTKTPNGDVLDLDVYEHAVIVRHEDTAPMTIDDMTVFDNDNDVDMPFTAATGTPDTLTIEPETGLYVWEGKTFAPDGNVALVSGGSGASYDGTLWLAGTSTFTAVGTESHSVGGSWITDATSIFNRAQSTVTFTATTSGKTIAPASNFEHVVLNGSGGTWSVASSTTVRGNLTATAGTLVGTGDVTVYGQVTGNGTIAMTGGVFTVLSGGAFGGNASWTFDDLIFSTSTATSSTKTGTGNITTLGTLTIGANNTLEAGSVEWFFSGSGTVFVPTGTFDPQTSTTTYNGSLDLTIAATDYYTLNTVPTSGTPIYTIDGGNFTIGNDFRIGGGSAVTVQADTNDPLITVVDDVTIASNAIYQSASSNDLLVGGSYDNNGTFTANAGGIVFNSSDTGETVSAGSSPFHHVYFLHSGGGWTLTEHATSTGNFSISSSSAWALGSGLTLEVQGIFSNSVGDATTVWTGSTLYLHSGTNYSINTSSLNGDVYGTLRIGANTDVRMWYSSSTSYSVNSTGSLYSQDHDGFDGDLYIWGDYARTTGTDYWNHATDFDGTALGGGSVRKVDVYVANGSTISRSGGTLQIIGTSTASTTVTNQGSSTYGFNISGGTLNASYYELRNMNSSGLNFSGSPTITSLSDGDMELSVNNGTLLTVAGSVITANPLKIMYRNRFATSSGITSTTSVVATGVTGSSWRFTEHYGNLDGEQYDSDPGGDPGYIIWDDSAAQITISGNVYGTNESSVSSVCDGSTPVVRFLINGANPQTTSCNAGTGYYQFTGIIYNVGDVFTVYLNDTSAFAANVTADPITNITDMHLYADRVVVRHEGIDPITIDDLDAYDADQDTDIPFDADTGSPGTFTLDPGGKLIVWDGKSLAPGGNVSVAPLGSGTSYDGTIELKDNAVFVAAGTENHTIGGSLVAGSGASVTAANSTLTFTATTTGKTIDSNTSSLANVAFSGVGGGWTFTETSATTTGDVTISAGTVVLPSTSLAIGGSFINSAVFTGTTTAFTFTASGAEAITFAGYDVGSLRFTGTGPWTMSDTNATTTGSVRIDTGSVSLPGGVFAVRTSFDNMGGSFTSGLGTVRLYGTEAAQTITTTGSALGNLTVAGSGSWSFVDTDATTTGSVTVATGGLTAPSGVFAIGGSLTSSSTFSANAGTLKFIATTTGNIVNPGNTLLGSVLFSGTGGGWTMATSATTTGDLRLLVGASFTMATSTTFEVGGLFHNEIGGSATDWTNSTLYLNASGTSYSINTKSSTGDTYAFLTVGSTTDVSMWKSSAATTTTLGTGSLYSQDDANNDGNLYIYGTYVRSSGSEYWSYATDFDGTALGGSPRPVNVRIASSSSVIISGGALNMVGVSGNITTVDVQVAGAYSFLVSGGTVNAEYYKVRSTDNDGLKLTGSPTITTLDNGQFELTTQSGSMLTVASSTVTANPSRTFIGLSFSTTTGITSGYNVTLTGSTSNIWQFTGHSGNLDGEAYDSDGVDACGQIRWSDSSCLEVSQTHYRFRNDDGGEAAPDSEWYDASWTKRKPVTLNNVGGTGLTDYALKIVIPYDADMQADFDDLRFTDASGTTSLSYWLESVSLTATATAWVKVPTVEADDVTRIFVYYGNALATSSESGADVFTFFDDFEDADIDEYSGTPTDLSYFDTNASYNLEGSYGLSASGGNTDKQTSGGIYRTTPSFAQGSTIRFFEKITAGTDDEPCTLFGVQSSGQNYAVCLDQYTTDRVVISEDVTSNSDDGSGTELAAVNVTWTSGWYEVEVDWLADDSINVTVYDSAGSVFATTSVTDGSYSSGGMGFTFWYQGEGWDFYSARPYVADEPSYRIGVEQGDNGATWKVAQDTSLTSQAPNENFRIRFGVENTGTPISGQAWRLQYAPKTGYGACEAVPDVTYNDTPNAAGCGTSPVCMTASPHVADQDATTEHLLTQFDGTFSSGKMVESPSNQTSSSTLLQNEFTEVEYVIEFTDFAADSSYCFRTTNASDELDTYLRVAEASLRFAPVISDWKLNNDEDIVLVEGETTTIYATGTISDLNGWEDILYATSSIYRSGVGEQCTSNLNNCYHLNSLECPLDCSGNGNSCIVECAVEIQYFAEPTDLGASSTEHWEALLFTVDNSNNTATATSPVVVDVLTLWGMRVTSGQIAYGTLDVGTDTGSTTATSTVRNTGNSAIDIQLAGSDMTAPGSSIPVANQKFATSTFTYSGCVICAALSGTASTLEVDLVKPTSTSTTITDDLYWGIYVPTGTGGQTHYGQNTFYATGD